MTDTMKLTDDQCKDIITMLRKKEKTPSAVISNSWHSFGGRIGQYSHSIQYGSAKKARGFNSYELERKLGDFPVIVEIYIPGMRGWCGDWIPSKTKYSTDLDDVERNCTYDSNTSITIWKIPRPILKKLEKETKATN